MLDYCVYSDSHNSNMAGTVRRIKKEMGKMSMELRKAVEEVKKQAEKPMTVEDAQVYVIKHLDARDKLEQLAEEAAELSQAALKLIRAKGLSNNVTPVDNKEALDNVKKEIIDVLMCVKACGFEFGDVSMVEAMENSLKWIRWAERLKVAKK